jgi:hypothetical protein
MRKIHSVFVRDWKNKECPAAREVEEGLEWVIDGEGTATVKWDGSACLVKDGAFYKRLHWKEKKGPAPPGWLHWSFDPEQRSGHGWFTVAAGNDDRWHREAWESSPHPVPDGTYELMGPKLQKNPESLSIHMLFRHGDKVVDVPRDYDGIRNWLSGHRVEGVVFHHADGRMAKVKRKDFGIPWPLKP